MVLKGIDLLIYVAVCGGSGSGKSTLLEILMQSRAPLRGTVKWDYKQSFRRNVGVIFQSFGMESTLDSKESCWNG